MTTSIELIIPTHNRSALLEQLLDSIAAARVPAGVAMSVVVVGSACVDDTESVVARFAQRANFRVHYLNERAPGKSKALNLAIMHASAEWLGFLDDDERVAQDWVEAFVAAERDLSFDFAAGRYIPDFTAPLPDWLPARFTNAVLAIHDPALPRTLLTQSLEYMWGGNCVIARHALLSVGLFDEELGRSAGQRPTGCEDFDMQLRLHRAGFRGWYLPEMSVFHLVPADRLTKAYFRNRVHWSAVSHGHLRRKRPEPRGAQLFGVDLWPYRAAAEAALRWAVATALREPERLRFEEELAVRQFTGFARAGRESPSLPG